MAAAGIRPFGISLDSPWSHRAWAEALGTTSVPLLSDALHEAAAGFGVLGEGRGVLRASRSAFLIRGDTVIGSWMLDSPQPDLDAIIAAATSA